MRNSLARPAWRPSQSAQGAPIAKGSTAAATVRSTPPIHRVAVTRARCHADTIEFVARKKAEGKTHREAIRSLKRHLARRIWQMLHAPHPVSETTPHPSIP